MVAFLAEAAPVLGAVGAGIGAIGAVQSGMANASAARYQAQVARNNQIVANQNASYAAAAGNVQTANVGLKERAQAGELTADLAAHGLDVNTGSAARVRASQREIGLQNEEQTAANAALSAYGYRTQATSFGAQAQLDQAQARQDVEAGFLSAGGTLLSGAGNLGFKWAGLQNTPAAGGSTFGPYGGYAGWAMGGAP